MTIDPRTAIGSRPSGANLLAAFVIALRIVGRAGGAAAFSAAMVFCFAAVAASSAIAAPPNQPAKVAQPGQAVGIVVPVQAGNPGLGGGGLPMLMYYNHINTIYRGDYRDAFTGYTADLGLGRMTATSRWIDSICYYTMIGESLYHEGKYAAALENFNAALRLQLAYPNWMAQVQFPTVIQANATGPTTPWGRTARNAKIWIPPQNMSVAVGQLFLNLQPNSSQVVTPPQLLQVGVMEIVPLHRAGAEAAAGDHGPGVPQRPI